MLPDERDAGHLWTMVRRARYLVRKAARITLDELLREEDHQFAVAKALELMGESVRHLSEGFCKAHPEVEWGKIKGMRHLLVHEYERVDWNLVWETITIHVPAFLTLVEPLVPELPPGEADDNPL